MRVDAGFWMRLGVGFGMRLTVGIGMRTCAGIHANTQTTTLNGAIRTQESRVYRASDQAKAWLTRTHGGLCYASS